MVATTTTTTTPMPGHNGGPAVASAAAAGSVPTSFARNPATTAAASLLSRHLVLARYCPPAPQSLSPSAVRHEAPPSPSPPSLWWPALKFDSMTDFASHVFDGRIGRFIQHGGGGGSGDDDDDDVPVELKKALTLKAMSEQLAQAPIETLCYLARPLSEYRMAGAAASGIGNDDETQVVQVQEYCTGIVSMNLAGYFESPHRFPSQELYLDFHRALDGAMVLVGGPDGQQLWLKKAQDRWRTTPPDRRRFVPAPSSGMASGAAQAAAAAAGRLAQDDDDDDAVPRPPMPASPMGGQSVAAVSCTEDSLVSGGRSSISASRPRRPPPSPLRPPRLTDELPPIQGTDTFEQVWHKFDYDGWEMYSKECDEDEDDDDDDDAHCAALAIRARNGYEFPSKEHFLHHLEEAYGWVDPNGLAAASNGGGMALLQSSTTTANPTTTRLSRRQQTLQDRQRAMETAEPNCSSKGRRKPAPSSGQLWSYLSSARGWKYYKAPRNSPYSWYYFQPGFSNRGSDNNMGTLGRDYFQSLDEVEAYCAHHGIGPPPTPDSSSAEDDDGTGASPSPEGKEAGSSPESEEDDEEMEEEDGNETGEEEMQDDEDDESAAGEEDHVDAASAPADAGYATPTGRTPKPQDPSRPILPSPPEEKTPDEERYSFPNLWHNRLVHWGWTIQRSQNRLDDWWYIKPAERMDVDGSNSAERRLVEGVDYFTSEDAVVAFIKERDAALDYIRSEDAEVAFIKERDEALEESDGKKAKAKKNTHRSSEKVAAASVKGVDLKKRKPETVDLSKGRGRTTKKQKKETSGKKSHPLADANLKVEPSKNTAPWATEPPMPHHDMCQRAVGITYSGGYRLPTNNAGGGGGGGKNSVKFDDIMSIVRVFAKAGQCTLLSGGNEPSNSDERGFVRLIRYAFVPGKYSDWREIRMLTTAEAKVLLQRQGYRLADPTKDVWVPPKALVDANLLEPQYDSLAVLCDALRVLEDLTEAGPSRKRNRACDDKNSATQQLALRLFIAEGSIAQDDPTDEACTERGWDSDASESSRVHSAGDERGNPGDSPKTPKRAKRISSTTEVQRSRQAMSPDSINVTVSPLGSSTAAWAQRQPEPPTHKLYMDMGNDFIGIHYYLRGEPRTNVETRFTHLQKMREYICTQGDYSRYLTDLKHFTPDQVTRHLDYAYVPGIMSSWKNIRKFKLHEVVKLLGLLGYEKDDDGWWVVPDGVPILTERRYATLSALGKALVRLPDLEDRTSGAKRSRRARKDDCILKADVMTALRLRIAEGLEDTTDDDGTDDEDGHELGDVDEEGEDDYGPNSPDDSRSEFDPAADAEKKDDASGGKPSNETNKGTSSVHNEGHSSLSHADTADEAKDEEAAAEAKAEALDRFRYDVCASKEVWRCLQRLGCRYSGQLYHLPRSSDTCENQKQLERYILENTVSVLNWNNCSIGSEALKQFDWYLRCVNARINSISPLSEAYDLMTPSKIPGLLAKIGFHRTGDNNYEILVASETSKNLTKTYTTDELVNLIRKSEDLYILQLSNSSPKRRHRSSSEEDEEFLTAEEELALRLWAAIADFPLTNFPDPDAVGHESCDHEVVTISATSKVMDLEEVDDGIHGQTCHFDKSEENNAGYQSTNGSIALDGHEDGGERLEIANTRELSVDAPSSTHNPHSTKEEIIKDAYGAPSSIQQEPREMSIHGTEEDSGVRSIPEADEVSEQTTMIGSHKTPGKGELSRDETTALECSHTSELSKQPTAGDEESMYVINEQLDGHSATEGNPVFHQGNTSPFRRPDAFEFLSYPSPQFNSRSIVEISMNEQAMKNPIHPLSTQPVAEPESETDGDNDVPFNVADCELGGNDETLKHPLPPLFTQPSIESDYEDDVDNREHFKVGSRSNGFRHVHEELLPTREFPLPFVESPEKKGYPSPSTHSQEQIDDGEYDRDDTEIFSGIDLEKRQNWEDCLPL